MASTLARVITASAERLAVSLHVPADNRPAFVATVESVLYAQWSSMFGGNEVRLYAPAASPRQRADRRARVLQALAAGVSPAAVARTEGVSRRWVEKLRRAHEHAPAAAREHSPR
jgi:hypothetical protein